LNTFKLVNGDTDSIMFCRKDGSSFTEIDRHRLLDSINSQTDVNIVWTDDRYYSDVIIVKSKNYLLKDAETGKVTIKGSALLASMKEPALRQFIKDILYALLEDHNADISTIYLSYVRSINAIGDEEIGRWASKKTITKAVLTSPRTNESRVRDAIKRAEVTLQEGDKIYTFFKDDETIELVSQFDGTYDKSRLYEKLFKTVKVFETILDIKKFPNFKLKKNEGLLEEVCNVQSAMVV